MINQKNLFKKHLLVAKQNLKDRLFEILNGTSFEGFTSTKLQEITNDLKEIETLLDFIDGEDFKRIIEKEENKRWTTKSNV